MTIRFVGYVEKMESDGPKRVLLTVRVPSERNAQPLVFSAERTEIDVYRIGTHIEVAITPIREHEREKPDVK